LSEFKNYNGSILSAQIRMEQKDALIKISIERFRALNEGFLTSKETQF